MHILLILSLWLGALQAVDVEIVDLTEICKNRVDGELTPHPRDCTGYFECHPMPTLLYCEQGLHFDAASLMCVLPEVAQCKLGYSTPSVEPTATSAPKDVDGWLHKPRPAFMAVDVTTGQQVNPMEKYDPQQVECRHFGAYFLPHPRNCQRYYLCAYGHMHSHQCGMGTLWNYQANECQLSRLAKCYSAQMEQTAEQQPEWTTTPGSQITVCYILTTSESSSAQTEPFTTATVTSTAAATATAPAPSRAPLSALTCPSERQSYLPHPDDCSKYYICIGGMPVLTSCPKGLYWDQKAGYCDQAKKVKCVQNK
ncbi:obst-F [Drosophila busckii]|uniref:Obst-F n=1 Tax=Drosophila busckii TaxID=30019 RepID=A0A0M3QWL7_DROBS|nr:obst-F [Drosophila busckii]